MLSSFLQVLLDSLINKSHNLLQEEIMQAVYNMVSSNFDAYFSQFVPTYLMNTTGLVDHQKSQLHQNYKRDQVTHPELHIMVENFNIFLSRPLIDILWPFSEFPEFSL